MSFTMKIIELRIGYICFSRLLLAPRNGVKNLFSCPIEFTSFSGFVNSLSYGLIALWSSHSKSPHSKKSGIKDGVYVTNTKD